MAVHGLAAFRADAGYQPIIGGTGRRAFAHGGEMPSMYYLRTRDGLEIDLVIEVGQKG